MVDVRGHGVNVPSLYRVHGRSYGSFLLDCIDLTLVAIRFTMLIHTRRFVGDPGPAILLAMTGLLAVATQLASVSVAGGGPLSAGSGPRVESARVGVHTGPESR
jgi:hypothetical protein